MKIEELKKEYTKVVSARIPKSYAKFIEDNEISLKKLIVAAVDELRRDEQSKE